MRSFRCRHCSTENRTLILKRMTKVNIFLEIHLKFGNWQERNLFSNLSKLTFFDPIIFLNHAQSTLCKKVFDLTSPGDVLINEKKTST